MNLKETVVVITGSTRGFGNATARALLTKGAKVVISGRKQETVDRAVAELSVLGDVTGLACDVSVAEQVYALARHAQKHFGRIDVWINNAGVTPPVGGILDFPPEDAETTFRVNCIGTLNGTQTAVEIMKRQGGGTIVNLYGRGSDLKPVTSSGLYGASKAWITSFTRTMAAEYKDLPIQIIGFSPGIMATDMLDLHEVVGDQVTEYLRNLPLVLAAFATPPEIPAEHLVKLLENNRKPFVEYHMMKGLRMIKMLGRLVWLSINKKAQPPAPTLTILPPFNPPIISFDFHSLGE